jgi:hypothetical protein
MVSAVEAVSPDGSLVLEGPTGAVADLLRLVRADLIPGFEIVEDPSRHLHPGDSFAV